MHRDYGRQNYTNFALFPSARPGKEVEIFDACGAYAAPGMIDLHIHGFAGFGPELGTEQALLDMSLALAQEGVTAFCPTLYCGKPEDMLRLVKNTIGAFGQEKGSHILGYHLEGPFISPQKPGVMKPQDIAPVDLNVLQELYNAAQGRIANMTAAPELPNITALAEWCKERNIVLQSGHTNATYEEFLQGVNLGMTHATHLFNAMSSFNHRAPGAAGAVLMHPEISAEIIADGVHVHPDLVAFLRRIKPIENLILVTDALLPTAQKNPPFYANREEVVFDGGVWKRKADGVIAGSALTMMQGVKNLVRFGYTLPEAIACASTNPARLLSLRTKGLFADGYDADIVIFDKEFRIIKTFIA
ncbi:MAG: N-acetylglucosamine-6-phosphate deacetylase [Elusimicrobiaceae bacterium]|nr:N-acetylglucosamine-6-phosphate deacetylase [Elusimicrobiaceae bacterium]